jgi:hypothetical protein
MRGQARSEFTVQQKFSYQRPREHRAHFID